MIRVWKWSASPSDILAHSQFHSLLYLSLWRFLSQAHTAQATALIPSSSVFLVVIMMRLVSQPSTMYLFPMLENITRENQRTSNSRTIEKERITRSLSHWKQPPPRARRKLANDSACAFAFRLLGKAYSPIFSVSSNVRNCLWSGDVLTNACMIFTRDLASINGRICWSPPENSTTFLQMAFDIAWHLASCGRLCKCNNPDTSSQMIKFTFLRSFSNRISAGKLQVSDAQYGIGI